MFSKSATLVVLAVAFGVATANHGKHGHRHGHHHDHDHHHGDDGGSGSGDHHHDHEEAHPEPTPDSNVAATFPGGSFLQINFGAKDAGAAQHSHDHGHDHGHEQPLVLDEPEFDPNNPIPDRFHPFNPRFEVSRVEIDDNEWLNELAGEFRSSGLLASSDADQTYFLMKAIPSGVVNINYDIHACVHMGTQLDADETVYPPTAISYPTDETGSVLHTLVMIDVDNRSRLHWLVVNIPGARVSEGQIVRGYNSPAPGPGSGPHRYVFLVMQQLAGRFNNIPTSMEEICKNDGRDNFNLELFKSRQHLSEPFAANYFTVEYDPFVENITPVCHGPNTRPIVS